MTAAMVRLEKRLRIAGLLLILGLLVEGICLLWARPIAFILLVVVGGLLCAAGIVCLSLFAGFHWRSHVRTMTPSLQSSPARHGLDALFNPGTVAVIGATDRPGTVGRTVLQNLLNPDFRGKVYPVNPHRTDVLGVKAYKSVGEIPEPIDLAVLATPAITIPALIAECVEAKVKSAVVISAGFRERGEPGAALEQQIQEQLKRGSMRLIGPNCLGIMNSVIGLNATFAKDAPRAGNVAFLSQSGALLTAILDWSSKEEVGFSGIVSTGSMLDVGWGDLIHHFGDDPHTQSILIYMESVGDARSFLSAAREVALAQTHHRHQSGTLRSCLESSRIPYRRAHRQRRSSGRGIPPLRRAASVQHRRLVLHGRSSGQAASPQRPPADYPDQCRRTRGTGD